MRKELKRESLCDKMVKGMLVIFVTVLLVLGVAFFVSGTALSQTEEKFAMDEVVLRKLEKEYVNDIRDYLEEQGFKNSGVTMTWVMEDDGSRSYKVLLYHKEINELSVSEQDELFAAVKDLAFEVNGCNFQVNLLV